MSSALLTRPAIELRLPGLHAAQRQVKREARRFNVVCCGRRFGKSILGIDRAVPALLHGQPVGWFNPTYKSLLEQWRELTRTLKPITTNKSESDHRIELLTGGVLEMWALDRDPEASRGRKYATVIVDEAAKVKGLAIAWQEAIRATLIDLKGTAWFESTPKGMGYFKTLYELGQDPLQTDWMCWQKPTSENPYIDASEIEAFRQQLPERVFRQEILAEFIDDAGGVFRGVAAAVDKGRTEDEPCIPGRRYTLGVDLARVEDFTVLSVVDQDRRQVAFERFNQISWERQIASIQAMAARYSASVILDSTGVGDPIHEAIRRLQIPVMPYHMTNQSKEALIDNLAMEIEQGRARLMDVQTQTAELQAYEYELTPSRNVRMGAPEGMHDDTVIALALGMWGARHRREVGFS